MRRLFVALSALACSVGTASALPTGWKPPPASHHHRHKVHHRHVAKRIPPGYFAGGKNHPWAKGERLYHWGGYSRVDWKQNNLPGPPEGAYWVRSDSRFLQVHGADGRVLDMR